MSDTEQRLTNKARAHIEEEIEKAGRQPAKDVDMPRISTVRPWRLPDRLHTSGQRKSA